MPAAYRKYDIIELELKTSVESHGWIDWQIDHTFYCQPKHEADKEIAKDLSYVISISDLTSWTDRSHKIKPENYIKNTTNPLEVGQKFFNVQHKYEVNCKAFNKTMNAVGGVKARFDTYNFEEDFNFTVSAVSGQFRT